MAPVPSGTDNGAFITPDSYSASDQSLNAPFSPRHGVTCFPAQEVCFNNNGSLAGRLTQDMYGK